MKPVEKVDLERGPATVDPPQSPSPEVEAKPDLAPDPTREPQQAPGPSPTPAPVEPGPEKPLAAESRPKVSKTAVTITFSGVYGQVKVDRKEYTFDRLNGVTKYSVKLTPGHHSVAFRNDTGTVWSSLGNIDI
ncbi:MAG: hypothetical protein KC431_02820, partial [Myxococcales bacterium]|nr:hypothetical protein [Myxococcales bacterium]